MQLKRFLISFTATALLVAPMAINANAPQELEDLLIAPTPGQSAIVDGLTVRSELIAHDKKTARIRIEAVNKGQTIISTRVRAGLMEPPQFGEMARMVPPPRELAHRDIAIKLEPGETFQKTITVKLVADPSPSVNLGPEAPSLYANVMAVPKPQKMKRRVRRQVALR